MISIISLFLSSLFAASVALMPTETYTINGFDTNDTNVQIGFDSMYPDACYQYMPVESQVLEDKKVIRINNLSEKLEGDIACAKVIRYFDEVVDLGPVTAAGTYDVQFLTLSGEYRSFTKVEIVRPEDSGNPDNALYAPVVDVDKIVKEGKLFARLTVKSAYACLKFRSIEVDVDGNTVVVRPMIEEPQCTDDSSSHITTKDISLEGLRGRYLLHVRSMNSKAINKFIEL